ncbi:MAG TPA: hypothetical protein VK448_07560 [Dissulfurispiraceae bacterium]|nr:hypothetical protein [Dissulfurispiraceae bacterium]
MTVNEASLLNAPIIGLKSALRFPFAVKGSDKFLDFWTADSAVPPFCLKIDYIKSKSVLFYNAVNAFVSALSNGFASIDAGAAVAKGHHDVHYESFKKLWRIAFNLFQDFCG